MTWLIETNQPFNFALSLGYLERRAGELVDRVEGNRYRRLVELDGHLTLVEVAEENEALRIGVPFSTGSTPPEILTAWVCRRFSIEDQVGQFYDALTRDPRLSPLTEAFHGLRPVLTDTPFEALVWAIIGQQITLSFAFSLKSRLVWRYSIRCDVEGEEYYTFPRPDVLAAASLEELRAMQFSARKAEYIIGLSQSVVSGELDLDRLGSLPEEEAISELVRLRGIGRWTAEYGLMRGWGATDALPAGDIALRNAVTSLYGLDHQASEAEVRELALPFIGWRSYWAFYLWATLWAARR